MTVPAKSTPNGHGDILETILRGDLGRLSPEARSTYLIRLCESLGLNPYSRPIEFITMNGKLVPYAKRDATDQLRKRDNVSIAIVSQDIADGLITVHVRARTPDGREDEDVGVVSLPDTLKGEARANTILRAITKAKRRVTLSICGLGLLDETEIEDARPIAHDPETGEVIESEDGLVTDEQRKTLDELIKKANLDRDTFLHAYKIETTGGLPIEKYENAVHRLNMRIAGNASKDA